MSLLEVKSVRFAYDDEREILKDVSFDADHNNIISILGPNGTGKTTLLKCICNIHRPSSGKITIDGTDILSLSSRELAKRVAYVPQKTYTSRITVFDSILIGRRPHIDWTTTQKDVEIAWSVIESLGLSDLSLKYVDEISGGEFQKVQIGRAITQEPKLLILDEPSNNLDIANHHITMRMINHVVREHGLCTIMTMHDINLATYYSDKFLFIKDGELIAYGGKEVINPDIIQTVYGIDVDVLDYNGQPLVVPKKDQPQYEGLVSAGIGGYND